MVQAGDFDRIDLYFDGCDQVDDQLNAFKSGGGIHTDEKTLAAMANRFILLCDADKYTVRLTTKYPLTIEVLPAAVATISHALKEGFNISSITIREEFPQQPFFTQRKCMLLEARFSVLPEL